VAVAVAVLMAMSVAVTMPVTVAMSVPVMMVVAAIVTIPAAIMVVVVMMIGWPPPEVDSRAVVVIVRDATALTKRPSLRRISCRCCVLT
jgi:hypothetical protein